MKNDHNCGEKRWQISGSSLFQKFAGCVLSSALKLFNQPTDQPANLSLGPNVAGPHSSSDRAITFVSGQPAHVMPRHAASGPHRSGPRAETGAPVGHGQGLKC